MEKYDILQRYNFLKTDIQGAIFPLAALRTGVSHMHSNQNLTLGVYVINGHIG